MEPSSIVVLVAACAGLGWAIGERKGYGVIGAVLGALLGPLGVIIILCIPKSPEAKAREQLNVERETERLRGGS